MLLLILTVIYDTCWISANNLGKVAIKQRTTPATTIGNMFFLQIITQLPSQRKKTCRENKEYTSSNNRPQPDLFWWHQLLEQFCFGFLFRTQSVVVRAQHNRDDGHDDEHFEDHHQQPSLSSSNVPTSLDGGSGVAPLSSTLFEC